MGKLDPWVRRIDHGSDSICLDCVWTQVESEIKVFGQVDVDR